VCHLPLPEPLPKTGKAVGVDVGVKPFATLWNGEQIENPRYLRRAEKALKRSQQALSRKMKKSANRAKARQRFALRHLKVQRARKDFHHKVALDLVRRFDRIAVEDLQIPNMLKNHKLAKSIADAGWGQFLAITQSKAENAGRVFERVDPRYTTQTCSACGHRQKMPLALRVFVCESCGHTICRDKNSAINIGLGKPRKPVERLNLMPRRRRNRNTGNPPVRLTPTGAQTSSTASSD
jgi:putative transposase